MVKALILYFLSVKPTHGYDIQRFIEINGVADWSKIQSGSLYYALNKLEKDGFIYTLREERTGARVRKIYDITDSGKRELEVILKSELLTPLMPVESDKYISYIMLNKLPKEAILEQVNIHLKALKEKRDWWEKGKELKITEKSFKLEVMHFDMVISSLTHQINWHEYLLEELDAVIDLGKGFERIIGKIDFATIDKVDYMMTTKKETFSQIENLKEDIVKNPENLEEKIDKLINLLKNV